MKMEKQTAVEFLLIKFNEIVKIFDIDENHLILLLDAIKTSKEMEKEQITEAFKEGNLYHGWALKHEPEQYYNKTYKKDK
jgi:hypothetical protein